MVAQPSVAIIGSGPSGCYLAQFLRKAWPESEITIFDRLQVPYGLVRFGVAPDHAGTKAVTQQFDRLFERDAVNFVGGTEVGKDIALESLREKFDVVVLATGLSADRRLSIPGEHLSGVHGSGKITRLINGHPESQLENIEAGTHLVIVGQGNVAIDLVRLSLTHPEQLVAVGVSADVAEAIAHSKIASVDVVGRSLISEAKFDLAMLKELGKVANVKFSSDAQPPSMDDANALKKFEALQSLISESNIEATRTVNFHFGWTPQEINGTDKVTGITFADKSGTKSLDLKADVVYTAIGFYESETATVSRDSWVTQQSNLDTGFLDDGLYCVGWLRRGPQGTIPANRADAKMVSETIISDFQIN